MNTRNHFWLYKALALVAGAVLFGCAPPAPFAKTAQSNDRMSALMSAGSSSVGSDNLSWNCPGQPNVNLYGNSSLNGGYDYSGAEDFTVCVPAGSARNATSFKVTGSSQSNALCFYPMNQPAVGNPVIVASPQCFNNTGGPIFLNFQGAGNMINFIVVVDANYTSAFNACLSSSAPCPAHSEGFVQ